MTFDVRADLELAHRLADRADAVSMRRFKALDLRVDTKPDMSEVTDADIATEQIIRAGLAEQRPEDAVHGEEGQDTGSSNRRWVIDPIDGTANYVRGVPVWASLIALMVDDEVVCSVVSAPAMRRRWWAGKDLGAFTGMGPDDGNAIHCSKVSSLDDASLSYAGLEWLGSEREAGFVSLAKRCWRTRAYGDFWGHMLLAEGTVDAVAELDLKLYDMAALDIIVREAGGRFTNLDGLPGPFGPGALASNGALHDDLLAALRP